VKSPQSLSKPAIAETEPFLVVQQLCEEIWRHLFQVCCHKGMLAGFLACCILKSCEEPLCFSGFHMLIDSQHETDEFALIQSATVIFIQVVPELL